MNRQILRLAIPSIFANITVPLVGMVDLAIAGHIADAAAIGGIAIGTMLFDLLYWNFGFLRVGTGGMTAQAYGKRDFKEAISIFTQGIATALGAAMILWLIQILFIEASFALIDCSADVESFARRYFFIRIWAAPATLSLMVFKGWFIGMQNTIFPMILDITINVVNMVGSYLLAVNFSMGVIGVAWGTLLAQYIGLLLAITLFIIGYRGYFKHFSIFESLRLEKIKRMFSINSKLFVRSLCFMAVYVGFTSLSAKYGDEALAVSSIMMKLMMIFSYFIDGFAYAGEALTGKFVGERNTNQLHICIKKLFQWASLIGVIFTFVYWFWGNDMFALMTSDKNVITAAEEFTPWLIIMPFISCAAFTWDGIYIGATAAKEVRNCMIWAAIGFILCYILLKNTLGIHALYVGYFAHLLIRTLYLSFSTKVLYRIKEEN